MLPRFVSGGSYCGYGGKNAFHLHNFFANATVLRNKYETYGHPVKEAMEKPLSTIHDDVQNMIDCVYNTTSETTFKLIKNGLETFTVLPIAFGIDGYIDARMSELKEMLTIDKNVYNKSWQGV